MNVILKSPLLSDLYQCLGYVNFCLEEEEEGRTEWREGRKGWREGEGRRQEGEMKKQNKPNHILLKTFLWLFLSFKLRPSYFLWLLEPSQTCLLLSTISNSPTMFLRA